MPAEALRFDIDADHLACSTVQEEGNPPSYAGSHVQNKPAFQRDIAHQSAEGDALRVIVERVKPCRHSGPADNRHPGWVGVQELLALAGPEVH
jgi:hypothetical protein